ncbi:MAG: lysophospholipid acyltransferase family protein [Polyangiales bacterium]
MIVKPGLVTRSIHLAGWVFETPKPPEKKYVLLCWPHTSNWDGLLLVALAKSIGLTLEWMVKDSWVKGPLGPVLRRVGAVPINRSKASNMVDQMVAEFARRDELALAIPPEGTRGRVDHWKSGFYRIALGANVPVVPGYLDFARKRAGLGPAITMTGNVKVDMDRIRAFYAKQNPIAHDPSKVGPSRLREED